MMDHSSDMSMHYYHVLLTSAATADWRALALYSISSEFSSRFSQVAYTSQGEHEPPEWSEGARSLDFGPLTEAETKAMKTDLLVSVRPKL